MTAPQRWASRSREARDDLWLLGVAAATVAPLAPHLPLWAGAATLALLGWRAALAWRDAPLPPRWLLAAVLALGVAAALGRFHTVFGRDAGLTLASLLLGLKSLEARGRRDRYVLVALGLFLVWAAFLYAQTPWSALWMLLCSVGWLVVLIDANLPGAQPQLRARLGLAVQLLALGIPAMVALFVLFPRIDAPLWSLPDDSVATTGLGVPMDPGAIARLARDDSVAFRVRFTSPRPPQRALYWRGPVLTLFDGHDWRAASAPAPERAPTPTPTPTPTGASVTYTVTLQPSGRRFAFALDAPTAAPALLGQPGTTLDLAPGDVLRANHRLRHVVRYTARSVLHLRLDADRRPGPQALQLPAGDNPRSVALGRALRARWHGNPTAIADAALALFRRQPFRYSLDPGAYRGRDQVDQFLFARRIGFCAHFAQAFVVLLRAAGVPARIVTGYQGGSANPIDGNWVVRQSDAHAWAEYWVRGLGWVRADPTAMVDPARVDRSGATLERATPLLGIVALGARDRRLLRRLRDLGDAVDSAWNSWVLDYGQLRQQRLLRDVGLHGRAEAAAAALAAGCAVLLAPALLLLHRRRGSSDPWHRLWARLRRELRAAGIEAAATEAPISLLPRLYTLPAPLRDECAALLVELERARYAAGGAAPLRVVRVRLRRLARLRRALCRKAAR